MEMPKRGKGTTPVIDPDSARRVISHGKMTDPEAMMKQISMKISAELLARCDEACRVASVTRSSFIKMAILEKLERENR